MFKSFSALFKRPSLGLVMLVELEQARHAMLEAQTARDYAQSIADYNRTRINRLTQALNDHGELS